MTSAATSVTLEPTVAKPGPVIIDLGKKKSSDVRKLRKGHGDLLDEVNEIMSNLKTSGQWQTKDQPVVVVVREKRRRKFGLL